MPKIHDTSSFSAQLANWLQGFWMLIGGFFRRNLNVITGQHTFTETGCQSYLVPVDSPPQKVWFTISQPSEGDCNLASSHRFSSDDDFGQNAILLYVDVAEAPCQVKWFIIC